MRLQKTLVPLLLLLTFACSKAAAQNYPTFGAEKKVTINGLTFDAMEPFISLDGNTLFFNSLNSGGNTNLYYATRINDTTFNYVGLVGGCYDSSSNHLDGVPAIDSLNNFFWVSLRNWPTIYENLHRGVYASGAVTKITRVYGDFNIKSPGWLIMDAGINYQGNLLYYSNAYFNSSCGTGIPCKAQLGIAQKVNDSTFNKTSTAPAILKNLNDTSYLVYAPHITRNGLELYYTRLKKGGVDSEVCVSVRKNITDTFSLPLVIHSKFGYLPEAPTITSDKSRLYYHQKNTQLLFAIYMRYVSGSTGMVETTLDNALKLFPNPSHDRINIVAPVENEDFEIEIVTTLGQLLFKSSNELSIDVSMYPQGIYFLTLRQKQGSWTRKIQKL